MSSRLASVGTRDGFLYLGAIYTSLPRKPSLFTQDNKEERATIPQTVQYLRIRTI